MNILKFDSSMFGCVFMLEQQIHNWWFLQVSNKQIILVWTFDSDIYGSPLFPPYFLFGGRCRWCLKHFYLRNCFSASGLYWKTQVSLSWTILLPSSFIQQCCWRVWSNFSIIFLATTEICCYNLVLYFVTFLVRINLTFLLFMLTFTVFRTINHS